jgi:hypothetical protein
MQNRTLPTELEQFILKLSTEKLEIAAAIVKALSKTQIHEKEPTFIRFKVQKEEQENMFLMLNCQENIFTAIQKQMKEVSKQIERNGKTRKRTRLPTRERGNRSREKG